jgi:hypothetical protein
MRISTRLSGYNQNFFDIGAMQAFVKNTFANHSGGTCDDDF